MDERQWILVIVGATKEGKKELLAIEGGYRESEPSWLSVLQDLNSRGLKKAPELAIGDGSTGFWKAPAKIYETTGWQRCWVHKTV
jgi:transposase-like protein